MEKIAITQSIVNCRNDSQIGFFAIRIRWVCYRSCPIDTHETVNFANRLVRPVGIGIAKWLVYPVGIGIAKWLVYPTIGRDAINRVPTGYRVPTG